MPQYVIYARKSTESEDRQVLSIDSQVRELTALAAHQGVTISDVLTESKSAKEPGRPVFNDLMRRVRRGQVHGIVTWKMDRLARNHLDTGQVLQALADGKLERVITSDRTYTQDGNDRLIGGFEFSMATKFIDDLRANTKRGLRERLNRGWATGLPPVGYLNDTVNKTIVRDPERFSLVRRMWELVLEGAMRPEQVVEVANGQWGFRTRRMRRLGDKPLSLSTFYKILTNPFYAGIIRLKDGRVFEGRHERMVSMDEFERMQRILGRPWRERPSRHEFAFTGILRCGSCGCGITAEEHRKRSGTYVYYHCSRMRKLPTGRCKEPAITERDLVNQLAEALGKLAIDPEVLEWIRVDGAAKVREELARVSTIRQSLAQDLKALDREDETLLSLRIRDLVTDEVFKEKRADIQTRRLAAQASLAGPERSVEDLQRMLISVLTFGSDVRRAFLLGPPSRRRAILEAVGSDYVLEGRQVRFTLSTPFDLIAQAHDVSEYSSETVPPILGIFEPPTSGSAKQKEGALAGGFSARLRIVDDLRKFFAKLQGDFRLPDLDANEPDLSLPYPAITP